MGTPYHQAHRLARPYAQAIVALAPRPPHHGAEDIEHAIRLQQGAIASTAIIRGHSVERTVRRTHPEIFELAATLEALAMLAMGDVQTETRKAA